VPTRIKYIFSHISRIIIASFNVSIALYYSSIEVKLMTEKIQNNFVARRLSFNKTLTKPLNASKQPECLK